jgi:hypothetical protein
MVLIEADTGGEWKVGADAHEHSSPVPVINVKVVLNDPAIRAFPEKAESGIPMPARI